VLDIGCGCGSTTLAIARKVGPTERRRGIDISHPMLTVARERAAPENLDNATFIEADAQTSRIEPGFDVVFSRFGVMFFDDSVRAFTNLHGALENRVAAWRSSAGRRCLSTRGWSFR
jgi:ubiquinone/menaquinone biosynthesis C-methylase UbiE